MAFPTLPSYSNLQDNGNNGNVNQTIALDSITLGQLRAMVGSAPKPKARSGRAPSRS